MKGVTIFTDGSCLGNPGPGGWACILRYGQRERVLQGGETRTTNIYGPAGRRAGSFPSSL